MKYKIKLLLACLLVGVNSSDENEVEGSNDRPISSYSSSDLTPAASTHDGAYAFQQTPVQDPIDCCKTLAASNQNQFPSEPPTYAGPTSEEHTSPDSYGSSEHFGPPTPQNLNPDAPIQHSTQLLEPYVPNDSSTNRESSVKLENPPHEKDCCLGPFPGPIGSIHDSIPAPPTKSSSISPPSSSWDSNGPAPEIGGEVHSSPPPANTQISHSSNLPNIDQSVIGKYPPGFFPGPTGSIHDSQPAVTRDQQQHPDNYYETPQIYQHQQPHSGKKPIFPGPIGSIHDSKPAAPSISGGMYGISNPQVMDNSPLNLSPVRQGSAEIANPSYIQNHPSSSLQPPVQPPYYNINSAVTTPSYYPNSCCQGPFPGSDGSIHDSKPASYPGPRELGPSSMVSMNYPGQSNKGFVREGYANSDLSKNTQLPPFPTTAGSPTDHGSFQHQHSDSFLNPSGYEITGTGNLPLANDFKSNRDMYPPTQSDNCCVKQSRSASFYRSQGLNSNNGQYEPIDGWGLNKMNRFNNRNYPSNIFSNFYGRDSTGFASGRWGRLNGASLGGHNSQQGFQGTGYGMNF